MLPFDNQTPEPTLTQAVDSAVTQAVEGRLGLRQAGEGSADALVRGTITRYEPDVPVAYAGTAVGQNQPQAVSVSRRLVQITVSVEIVDQKTNRTLWQRAGLMVQGDYEPPGQTELDGRRKALDNLVTNIVDGAQSQW